MNRRDNIPKGMEIPEKTKRLIAAEFLKRRKEFRQPGWTPGFVHFPFTEKDAKNSALKFCFLASMKIRNLTPVLKDDAAYHGGSKTTEWAKQDLVKLAASIRHFRGLKKAEGRMSHMLLQTGWVTLKYPLMHDLTFCDMMDMLATAAEFAAGTKVRPGKQPVSTTEAYMWGAVGSVFKDCTGVKPTATPSGFFATVCECVANGFKMDVPSRKVLQAAMAYTK